MHLSTSHPYPIARDTYANSTTRLKKQWIAITLVLIVLGVIALPHDITIAQFFTREKLPRTVEDVLERAETFAHGIGIASIFIVLFTVDFYRRWAFPRVILATISAGIAANCIKLLISRLRPHSADLTAQITETFTGIFPLFSVGSSHRGCPSAHTTVVFAFAVGLCWLYPRGRYLFFSLAILAALQRITSGAHFFSDVCWGASLGYFIGMGFIGGWFTLKRFDRWELAQYNLQFPLQLPPSGKCFSELRKKNAA